MMMIIVINFVDLLELMYVTSGNIEHTEINGTCLHLVLPKAIRFLTFFENAKLLHFSCFQKSATLKQFNTPGDYCC